ncbi:MAG: uroporphyrinogen decarboxylase family protein [Saccharofermentanales bacterium]
MNSRERVIKAIEFENPDCVPIWFFNKDQECGDILWYDFSIKEIEGKTGKNGEKMTEWGYYWKTLDDGTMGQPAEPVIPEWNLFGDYEFPTLSREKRLKDFDEFKRRSEGYYRLPLQVITGFTTYTFLRGFENAMMDFYEEPEKAGYLLDRIFGFEKELIALAAEVGFDGFHFGDDWGTQESLIISPGMWREIFKPRYKDIFDFAHEKGLHVWYHSCGNIDAIVEDFHEIGVDVMNIAQPNVNDIVKAGEKLRGKQCFLMPISYQTVSITGTVQDIIDEGRKLYDLLAADNGGFIGYVEEYRCMGMSDENYNACIEAFKILKS